MACRRRKRDKDPLTRLLCGCKISPHLSQNTRPKMGFQIFWQRLVKVSKEE
jgi:hypothetical protein